MINITSSLCVDYENVNAVNDINPHVPKGQIYGLVGPNGVGKTSTMKGLAGVIEPTYAKIRIDGFDMALEREAVLCNIGYMPDFSPVYENLKVWECLDIFAAAYLIDYAERPDRIKYWIEKVDLTTKYDAFIRDLSRGMKQRLVLAKTLLPENHFASEVKKDSYPPYFFAILRSTCKFLFPSV